MSAASGRLVSRYMWRRCQRISPPLVARRWALSFSSSSHDEKDIAHSEAGGLAEVQIMDLMDYLDSPAMVSPDTTVAFAIDELVSRRVGSLLTCSPKTGEIIGVFTGRDVLRKLVMHADKRQALSAPVSDIMTPAERMVYCSPEDTVSKVRLLMRSLGVRNLPVLNPDSGLVVALVTVKNIADYASFRIDGVGGKGSFLRNMKGRRGLPTGTRLIDYDSGHSEGDGAATEQPHHLGDAGADSGWDCSADRNHGGATAGVLLGGGGGTAGSRPPGSSRGGEDEDEDEDEDDDADADADAASVVSGAAAAVVEEASDGGGPKPAVAFVQRVRAGAADKVLSDRGGGPSVFSTTADDAEKAQRRTKRDGGGGGGGGGGGSSLSEDDLYRLAKEGKLGVGENAFDDDDDGGLDHHHLGGLNESDVVAAAASFERGQSHQRAGLHASAGGAQTYARHRLPGGYALDTLAGAHALPHPFKMASGCANNRREYGPGKEVCEDVELSEDAHFLSRVQWPAADLWNLRGGGRNGNGFGGGGNGGGGGGGGGSSALTYVGVADGVGSWRGCGVDPRLFSKRLMEAAQAHLERAAANAARRCGGENEDDDGDGHDGGGQQPHSVSSANSNDAADGYGSGHQRLVDLLPPNPLEILERAWEDVVAEGVVGSCTACLVTLDNHLNQLSYANLGDSGVMILRHIDSEVAGYYHRKTENEKAERNQDLKIAFLSQQQLHSFNYPYQLGYDDPAHYTKSKPPTFDQPLDANVTGYATRPGDIVIVATDGLYDNVELDEICAVSAEWEDKWFGGPSSGKPLSDMSAGGGLSSAERETRALNELAQRLCELARKCSLDASKDSPFAVLAKENDILWGGGMPDDCTVIALRIMDAERAAAQTAGSTTKFRFEP